MANLCIKTPSSAILVLIFQLLVLRPRPSAQRWWASGSNLSAFKWLISVECVFHCIFTSFSLLVVLDIHLSLFLYLLFVQPNANQWLEEAGNCVCQTIGYCPVVSSRLVYLSFCIFVYLSLGETGN